MSVYINRALSVSISIVRLCASETLSRCTKWGAFGTQRSELASHYVFFFLGQIIHVSVSVLMAVSGVHCRELALPITNEHSE